MEEVPNINYIIQLSNGDESIKKRLINVLKEELPMEVENYNANIEKLNWLEAAENVHKLRHKIGFLGLENAYQLSYEYEQNLREQSILLKKEFEVVLKKIINFISEL
jgi:HPt (histidine-containing phosphotransfer) domain-containing protein